MLSLNAGVLHRYGDRGLAVCSADWAIRYYLAKGQEINSGPLAESLMHGGHLRTAAGIAAGLLGLEAHCLFASASRTGATLMRSRFHEFGGTWARLLLALVPGYEGGPDPATGEDLQGWLAGVVVRLQPFTTHDGVTRHLVEECVAFIERGPG